MGRELTCGGGGSSGGGGGGGGNTNLVGGVYWGEIFLGRGRRGWNEQIFSWGDSPPSPSRENPVKCSHI